MISVRIFVVSQYPPTKKNIKSYKRWENVVMRNCRGGKLSQWENVGWEIVFWEIVVVGNYLLGNCRVRNCRVGIRRVGNCRVGNCRFENLEWETVVWETVEWETVGTPHKTQHWPNYDLLPQNQSPNKRLC